MEQLTASHGLRWNSHPGGLPWLAAHWQYWQYSNRGSPGRPVAHEGLGVALPCKAGHAIYIMQSLQPGWYVIEQTIAYWKEILPIGYSITLCSGRGPYS